MPSVVASATIVIEWEGLASLFRALQGAGYRVVGPTLKDRAIVLEEISSPEELPLGVGDAQDGGSYRVRARDDRAAFGHAVGPQSWRRFLTPSRELLWRATRSAEGFLVEEGPEVADPEGQGRLAFIGVRSCDLRAMQIQDLVFATNAVPDPRYASRRADALIIAVNCTEPGGTCFCTSMGTGPRVGAGFDLALTEMIDGGHRFLVEVGTRAGEEIMASVASRPAGTDELRDAHALVESAADRMGRALDTGGLRELMAETLQHPQWDRVAERCLSCGNCTLVCPTCFCSTVEDATDLSGEHAERWRRWDSCFTLDFSFLHGGSVRTSTKSRYRQWLTHKLGTWHDQFGTSGCVGCGRCITWCPVGIDLTEEVAALRRPAPSPAAGTPT